jgi:hypothetical protein
MASEIEFNEFIPWDDENENLMEKYCEVSKVLHRMYEAGYRLYYRYNLFFQIPIIILSSVAALLSFISNRITLAEFPIIVGVISVISTLLSTISNYLEIPMLSKSYSITAKAFEKLADQIEIQLTLRRSKRVPFNVFLKVVKDEYNRIREVSNILPSRIVAEYKGKYTLLKGIPDMIATIQPVYVNKIDQQQQVQQVIEIEK